MPIWLRKFTFHEINTFYLKQQEDYNNQTSDNKTTAIDSSGKVNTPAFAQVSKDYKSSTYTTRASRK